MKYKIGDIVHLKDGTELEVCQASSVQDCSKCYFGKTNPNEKYPKIIPNFCTKPVKMGACCGFYRGEVLSMYFREINNKNNNNMEEKRSIKISLEEAKEWYNSGNSFKRELALKTYSEWELTINYSDIIAALKDKVRGDNLDKSEIYRKLLNVAKYFNNIYSIKYDSHSRLPIYYTITKKWEGAYFTKYKDFSINKVLCKSPYEIAFHSEEAAKQAIDILGDELKILFE